MNAEVSPNKYKIFEEKIFPDKVGRNSREIYIVDDSPDYRVLTRKMFKEYLPEYKLQVFERGQALYQHLMLVSADTYKGNLPGLILLDLQMPGIDGYNLLKLIRQRLNTKNVPWKTLPVIILTSEASNEQVVNCYNIGATSVITKPLDFDEQKEMFKVMCDYWLRYNLTN